MITKCFELRDRGTFIPVIATKMIPDDDDANQFERERYLLRRAGYGFVNPCVVLCRMDANGVARCASYDPYSWGADDRTFCVAHNYITEHFDELALGAVVDVEFILKETTEPKKSEREV